MRPQGLAEARQRQWAPWLAAAGLLVLLLMLAWVLLRPTEVVVLTPGLFG